MYKLIKNFSGTINQVLRLSDNAIIPFDEGNTDAKQFAKWLSEDGIPESAVEGDVVTVEWIAETIAKLS
jgi:hypothetical protein